jgi:hypothetical protein
MHLGGPLSPSKARGGPLRSTAKWGLALLPERTRVRSAAPWRGGPWVARGLPRRRDAAAPAIRPALAHRPLARPARAAAEGSGLEVCSLPGLATVSVRKQPVQRVPIPNGIRRAWASLRTAASCSAPSASFPFAL